MGGSWVVVKGGGGGGSSSVRLRSPALGLSPDSSPNLRPALRYYKVVGVGGIGGVGVVIVQVVSVLSSRERRHTVPLSTVRCTL